MKEIELWWMIVDKKKELFKDFMRNIKNKKTSSSMM